MNDNLISKLANDKIKINWNDNIIPMDLFLSFLTIETEISRDHLGSSNGWTRRVNTEYDLIIGGGIVNGVNYLDSLQFGKKLQNKYNNYVNPFYLFRIMNSEGKSFFLNYYKEDIEKVITEKKKTIDFHKSKVKQESDILKDLLCELVNLKP